MLCRKFLNTFIDYCKPNNYNTLWGKCVYVCMCVCNVYTPKYRHLFKNADATNISSLCTKT